MANAYDRLVADLEAGLSAEERELYAAFGDSFSLEREVRALRCAVGLSQTRLAVLSGVPQSEISKIERGKTVPTFPRLRRLVQAMGGDVLIVGPGLAAAAHASATAQA